MMVIWSEVVAVQVERNGQIFNGLKVEPIELFDSLECGGRMKVNSKAFDLSNWESGVFIN